MHMNLAVAIVDSWLAYNLLSLSRIAHVNLNQRMTKMLMDESKMAVDSSFAS